jgi:hypothetical protein
MKKFIILYNGPATQPEQMDPTKRDAIMAQWGKWMEKVGSAMVDMGQPMAPGEAVVDNGSARPALLLSGYSIIQADSMEAAKKLVEDHPFLSDKTGNFSVELFELMPVPGM